MKKSKKKYIKFLAISFIALIGMYISYAFDTTELNTVEANLKPKYAEQLIKPGHAKYYKLGEANDIEMSFANYNDLAKSKSYERQNKLAAIEKQAESSKKKEVVLAPSSSKEDTSTKEDAPAAPVAAEEKEVTHNAQPTQARQAPAPALPPAPVLAPKEVPAAKPSPEAKTPPIGINKIGINGIYYSYTNYGRATTEQFQAGIDAGLIVAGFTHFNGNDGETTYFGGHNPGIMRFMEDNIHVGATVTVTDGNGQAFNYKMIDKVDVDEYGEGVLTSIGRSAIDVYMYGTGTESILIQFCNTNNYLMSFWYGVKME